MQLKSEDELIRQNVRLTLACQAAYEYLTSSFTTPGQKLTHRAEVVKMLEKTLGRE